MRHLFHFAIISLLALGMSGQLTAAEAKAKAEKASKKKKASTEFHWVNEFPASRFPLLKHGTFHSQTNDCEVGYYIYLPPGYDQPGNARKHYPVVYYLHGGRPGGEYKSAKMADFYDAAMRAGRVPPMIYVFVNGGKVSHYDYPQYKSYGETAFVKELIPHIDAAYRTIARREGRGLEGFSQGGRGTARIMFKFPELFCSAAPMGGGHAHEKYISEHNGMEEGGLQFEPKNNSYDLADAYVPKMKQWPLHILVAYGHKDFNYEGNEDWTAHLKSLGIPYEKIIAGDAPHSAQIVYQNIGDAAMLFHARNFKLIESKK